MQQFSVVEKVGIEKALFNLPQGHPARSAFAEGRSLVEIAHSAGSHPEVMTALLELNVARDRRLRVTDDH